MFHTHVHIIWSIAVVVVMVNGLGNQFSRRILRVCGTYVFVAPRGRILAVCTRGVINRRSGRPAEIGPAFGGRPAGLPAGGLLERFQAGEYRSGRPFWLEPCPGFHLSGSVWRQSPRCDVTTATTTSVYTYSRSRGEHHSYRECTMEWENLE